MSALPASWASRIICKASLSMLLIIVSFSYILFTDPIFVSAAGSAQLSAETEKTTAEYGSTPVIKLFVTTDAVSLSGVSFTLLYDNLSHIKFNPAGSSFSVSSVVDGGQVGATITSILAATSREEGLSGKLFIGELTVQAGPQLGGGELDFTDIEVYDNTEALNAVPTTALPLTFRVVSEESAQSDDVLLSEQVSQTYPDDNGTLITDDDGNVKVLSATEVDEILTNEFPSEQFDAAIDASEVSKSAHSTPIIVGIVSLLLLALVIVAYLLKRKHHKRTSNTNTIAHQAREEKSASRNPTTEQDAPVIIKPTDSK